MVATQATVLAVLRSALAADVVWPSDRLAELGPARVEQALRAAGLPADGLESADTVAAVIEQVARA